MNREGEKYESVTHHDLASLLFSEDEAKRVGVGSGHKAKVQRLLHLRQLTHVHWRTHTHTHTHTHAHTQ